MKLLHFKLALKKLIKNRFTTFLNVAGLSIGIAAFVILMYYVSFEQSFDRFHLYGDNIYRVESQFLPIESSTDELASSAFGYGPAMREEIPEVEEFCRVILYRHEKDVKYNDIVFREEFVVNVDSNFFEFFSFELLRGSSKDVLSEPLTVALSESAARKYFNKEDPIGKMLEISNQNTNFSYRVTGVFADFPDRSHLNYDFLLSFPYQSDFYNYFWYMHDAYTYIKADPEDPETIEKKFIDMSEKYKVRPALKEKTWAIKLVPLTEIHMNEWKPGEYEQKGNKSSVRFLGIVAIIIIVIAWVNYISIATTKGLERAEELKIFRIHGAQFQEVLKMILAESLFVNLLAFIFSITFILVSIPLVERFLSGYIFGEFWSLPAVWFMLAGSLVLGILVTGLIPALLLIRNEQKALRGISPVNGGNEKLRGILITIQFMISVLLIIITLVVQKQNTYLRKMELGIEIERTLVIKTPTRIENFTRNLQSLKQDLRGLSFVNFVTGSSSIPGKSVGHMLSNSNPLSPDQRDNLHEVLRVDEDYIPSYKLEFAAGRNLTGNLDADNTSLIINETSAELYGFESAEDAVGREVHLEGIPDDPFTIIGVLRDFHHMSAKEAKKPLNMVNTNYHRWIGTNYYSVKLISDDMKRSVSDVKKIYDTHFHGTSFNYFFLDDQFNQQYEADIKFGRIFKVFTWLGIFIVCLGLIGLTNFILLKKTKEIGIRKVHGARVYDIIRLINKGFIYKLMLAFIIACPLAYYGLTKWLETFAERTSISWWVFFLSGIIVLIVAVLTVSIQSWKTAAKDPVDVLRYE
jgi:putative ABC transport system permease protein